MGETNYLETLIDISERTLRHLTALATKDDLISHERDARERGKDLSEKLGALSQSYALLHASIDAKLGSIGEGVSDLRKSDSKIKWLGAVLVMGQAFFMFWTGYWTFLAARERDARGNVSVPAETRPVRSDYERGNE
jgi:hypothetical protein